MSEPIRVPPPQQSSAEDLVCSAESLFEFEDLDGAERIVRQVLSRYPDHLPAYALLVRLLEQRGQRRALCGALKLMLDLRPDDFELWLKLGRNQIATGDWDASMHAFRHARRLRPDDVEIASLLATACLLAQRVDQLRRAVEFMTGRFPEDAQTALLQGHLAKIDGDTSAACEAYKRALTRDNSLSSAMYNLADTSPPASDSQLARSMQQFVSRHDLKPADRANALFALGRIFEAERCTDSAFEYYRAANDAASEAMKLQGIVYDRAAEERRAAATHDLYAAAPRPSDSTFSSMIRPIFIVGMPRSGTSLVEQILAGHSLVAAGGELPLIPQLAAEFEGSAPDDRPDPLVVGDARVKCLTSLRQRYLEGCFNRNLDRPYMTDKLPHNFQSLGFIRLMFPDAVIVHCVRDPLATCWSLYRAHFSLHLPYSNSFDALAHQYGLYARVMRHWEQVLEPSPVRVVFENLTASPRTEIARLLRACGLTEERQCFEHASLNRPVFTASQVQVRRPITSDPVARWRLFERHLAPLREQLDRELEGLAHE
jgi:tetratricopeptide (TPR) repeat protein